MKNTSRLLAADERGLPITVLVAGVLVVSFDYALHIWVSPDSWTHDFFFKRGFVQWVLISAFAVGLVHLGRRLPQWLREKRALGQLYKDSDALTSNTLVGRRWCQVQAARKEPGQKNLGQYAKGLAEHDDAEVDAAYRVSGDIVQILPLMGFFGTVFGLSHGLYRSFLATGGTNTRDFARAIAIAFDNTLLGLALTIILFVIQSLLRKREEAILLQLNLAVNDVVAEAVQEPAKDPLQVALEAHELAIKGLGIELEKSRKVLEVPSDGLKELIQTYTTNAAEAVLNKLVSIQYEEYEKLGNTVLSQLKEQANRLLDVVGERTLAFTQLGDPMRVQISEISTRCANLLPLAQSISDAISALARNTPRPQLEELSTAVKALVAALAQRDEALLNRLRTLDETRTKLEAVGNEAHATAQAVIDFGHKLDAVPEERRTVEDLASSIKELAKALAQRESLLLDTLQGSLATHTRDIKSEIRQPRTFKFVEAPQLPDGDGAASK